MPKIEQALTPQQIQLVFKVLIFLLRVVMNKFLDCAWLDISEHCDHQQYAWDLLDELEKTNDEVKAL